jgi:hypothetical protein
MVGRVARVRIVQRFAGQLFADGLLAYATANRHEVVILA